ncbi:MAG: hypothetical protein QM831_32815 [Kofleriaceae bacterium]
MRALLLVGLLACDSHHGEIPCEDAVAHGVKFSDAKDRGELTEMLVTQCNEEKWPATTRKCLVDAKNSHDVSECARTMPHSAKTVPATEPTPHVEEHAAPDAAGPTAPGVATPHATPE